MRLIDLSQPIADGMAVYPGDPAVRIEVVHSHRSHGWLLRRLELGSHTGTHVDAPSHMVPSGRTLDDVPLERFAGVAMRVSPGREESFPRSTGLLFDAPADLDIVEAISAAGAPFVGGELSEELERELLRRDIITFTGLVNLEQLPFETPFTFFGLPLRLAEGDGSPVRAVAILSQ
jgi:kynurenine formamidase